MIFHMIPLDSLQDFCTSEELKMDPALQLNKRANKPLSDRVQDNSNGSTRTTAKPSLNNTGSEIKSGTGYPKLTLIELRSLHLAGGVHA